MFELFKVPRLSRVWFSNKAFRIDRLGLKRMYGYVCRKSMELALIKEVSTVFGPWQIILGYFWFLSKFSPICRLIYSVRGKEQILFLSHPAHINKKNHVLFLNHQSWLPVLLRGTWNNCKMQTYLRLKRLSKPKCKKQILAERYYIFLAVDSFRVHHRELPLISSPWENNVSLHFGSMIYNRISRNIQVFFL